MAVVVNIVLLAARWSRDRQLSYILLISFSGKLFPLIFHPHMLQLEQSVNSSTLHHKQSHHEEVPGWQTDVERCLCWVQLKQLHGKAGGAGRGGVSFLPSLENTWSGAAGKALLLVPFVSLFLTFGMTLKESLPCSGGCSKHKAPRSITKNFPDEASKHREMGSTQVSEPINV